MKTFTIHSVRNVSAFFIALGLGYMAYTVSPTSVTGPKVEATSTENVSGYAWSDNIGWISFNDTTGGNAAQPYGVNINTSGDISGIAWSSGVDSAVGPQGFVEGGIGAISFNRADTGNPPGAPYQTTGAIARVNITTGAVTGWARALSACNLDASGNLSPTPCTQNSNAGGWDGWIKLSKDPSDTGSTTYGVVKDPATGKFSGYAWGGAKVLPSGDSDPTGASVIGWISFAGSGASWNGTVCTGTNDYLGTNRCNYGVKGPVGVCEASNTSIFWSQCDASDSCVSGGPVIQTSLTGGVEYGTCADGSTGSPLRECTAPTTTCEAGSGTWFTGDTKCSPGEPLTSPDCKPKTRFWQF